MKLVLAPSKTRQGSAGFAGQQGLARMRFAASLARFSDRARGPAAQRRDGEEVSPPAEAATVARGARRKFSLAADIRGHRARSNFQRAAHRTTRHPLLREVFDGADQYENSAFAIPNSALRFYETGSMIDA
ncbi:MAG: hypothetical protein HYZ92_05675 [Candidatus Omnitrophica bacterium]|nr:hypothetical protein [Candidatus Omnitrophota bacterium]